MTSVRSDMPRLAASLSVLGTELERKGVPALDTLLGWTQGPTRAPTEAPDEVCTCAHTMMSHYLDSGPCTFTMTVAGEHWSCPCFGWTPGQGLGVTEGSDDRRHIVSAARHHDEYLADLRLLNAVVQRLFRRLDMACPPDMRALRNRLTGDFDPETPMDALAQEFCPNCWAAGVKYVPLSPADGQGNLRRYSDRCRPCGEFRSGHDGFDKPKEIVVGHAQIPPRRFSPDETERIVAAARAAANPKKKTKKSKRKKAA